MQITPYKIIEYFCFDLSISPSIIKYRLKDVKSCVVFKVNFAQTCSVDSLLLSVFIAASLPHLRRMFSFSTTARRVCSRWQRSFMVSKATKSAQNDSGVTFSKFSFIVRSMSERDAYFLHCKPYKFSSQILHDLSNAFTRTRGDVR